MRLGRYFGNSAQFCLDLQSQYDIAVVEREKGGEIAKRVRPGKAARAKDCFMKAATEIPVLAFASAKAWRQWLAKHYKTSGGIWLRLFRKTSATPSVSYAEALDAALCYGWIDGQLKSHDAQSWLRKFTPRRAKSIWSKKNLEHVARLTKAGKMKAAGLQAVAAAKADGRLKVAYDAPGKSELPKDFLTALSRNAKAKAFFATLNRANVYAITFRLQTAKKPETREKRMKAILEMLERGEKFH